MSNRPVEFPRSLRDCLEQRGLGLRTRFVETVAVAEGVVCDVYQFEDHDTHDLAVVRVRAGMTTPLQRVLAGDETVEGHVAGQGVLTITSGDGRVSAYEYPGAAPIAVQVGEVMQWHAHADKDLVFFELCAPPYADGRFENLS